MSLRDRVLAERDRQRRLVDAEADREAMARNAHGRSWASTAVDLSSRSQDPFARRGEKSITVEGTPPPTRSPTVTLSGQADQGVDGVSDDVLFSAKAGAPRDEQWFDVSTPTTQVVVPLSGRLWADVDWRWGLLDDPSDGRFRTSVHLRVTRTRGGVTAPVDYEDPQVGPGGRVTDPGWSVEKGDVLTFRLLHDAGAERTLGKFTVGLTEVETQVSAPGPSSVMALAEEDATGDLWLVTVGTSDGAVTKVAQWSSTDEEPDFKSGMDVSGGNGWSQMGALTGSQTRRAVKFDLASAAVELAEPDDTSTPTWGNAAPAGAAVGGGVLWTIGLSGSPSVATAYRVDMATGLDDGNVTLTPSGGNTVSLEGRWVYHDGTLYGTPQLDDGNWYLLGFNPSTGAETSRQGLSAVVTEGVPVGLSRRSDGTWWLADESGTAGFLRQFDPDDGSLLASQQYSTGDWFVYGMAFS